MNRIKKVMLGALMLCLTSIVAAENTQQISVDELVVAKAPNTVILDVRTPAEFAEGFVPGAINIPIADLPVMFGELSDKDAQVVVYCRSGRRAQNAIEFLQSQGYTNLKHLEGDFPAWAESQEVELPKKE